MTRAVLHLGFHKTGTSSAQHFLARNRKHLGPHLQILLEAALKPAEKAARRFSKTRSAAALIDVATGFRHCLRGVDPAKPLLVSCEGLAGEIPGRDGVADYSALVELAPIIADITAAVGYAPDATTLLLSLRQPRDWLRSTYLHNLRGTRLTLGHDEFAETFRTAADLAAIAEQVRSACPAAQVRTVWLEDTAQMPHGPASPLFDAFDLPGTALGRLGKPDQRNPAPDTALADALLHLNRSDLAGDALKSAKQALIKDPQRQKGPTA